MWVKTSKYRQYIPALPNRTLNVTQENSRIWKYCPEEVVTHGERSVFNSGAAWDAYEGKQGGKKKFTKGK